MHTFEECMNLLQKLKRLEREKFHTITFFQDYSGRFDVDTKFGFYFLNLNDLFNKLTKEIEQC